MSNYNLVIIENKQCILFLNLTEQAFYNKLWEWTYDNDLWDFIDENNPTDEEIDYVLDQFINEHMFHKWEDDTTDCFAFVNTDEGIVEYQISEKLFDFIKSKIKEHYENMTFRVEADSIDEASDLVLSGTYDEVVQDSEEGEMEDPEVTLVERV